MPGGGFLYTNLDTLSVGVVLKLPALAAQQRRPEEIIAGLKAHPAIAPLVEGGELKEYSAHVIPEGGWRMMPRLAGDGLLVAGDAAALCLAAGIWLEGVNFAHRLGPRGRRGGRRRARRRRHLGGGAGGLPPAPLQRSFVLADHKRLRNIPHLVLSDRVQHQYPQLVCDVVERMFRVDNPAPKPGLRRILGAGDRSGRAAAARPRQGRLDGGEGLRVSATERWPDISFEDRMATVEFRVAPDGPHHRRRRLVPRLHARRRAWWRARPTSSCRPPTAASSSTTSSASSAARCYLVCNVEGAITWTLPRGRPRRGVPPDLTRLVDLRGLRRASPDVA